MKVLFISHEANSSGAPMALLQILRGLRSFAPDMDFEVLLKNDGPARALFEELCPVTLCDYSEPLTYRIRRKLGIGNDEYPAYLQKLDLHAFDLVYANTVATLRSAILIKHKYRIPIILHCHESEMLVKMSGLTLEMMRECDGFIAVSSLCKKNLTDNFGISVDKILVHYPISTKLDYNDKASDERAKGFVFGLGTINHWIKGSDIAPIVIKRFFDKYPDADCRFLALGMDDEVEKIKFEYDLRRSGVVDKCIILPHQENPMDTYASYDVCVLTSREESFSLVAQEIAILGKPIVLFSGASGISDWLDDTSSIQVPYLDIEAMVDAMYKLYSESELRECIGRNARNAVNEKIKQFSNVEDVATYLRSFASK